AAHDRYFAGIGERDRAVEYHLDLLYAAETWLHARRAVDRRRRHGYPQLSAAVRAQAVPGGDAAVYGRVGDVQHIVLDLSVRRGSAGRRCARAAPGDAHAHARLSEVRARGRRDRRSVGPQAREKP